MEIQTPEDAFRDAARKPGRAQWLAYAFVFACALAVYAFALMLKAAH